MASFGPASCNASFSLVPPPYLHKRHTIRTYQRRIEGKDYLLFGFTLEFKTFVRRTNSPIFQVFQKELGKRTGTVQVLKRSGRELIENSRDDTTWVKGQLQELSTRWDTVCKLSVCKQSRLEQALKQVRQHRGA